MKDKILLMIPVNEICLDVNVSKLKIRHLSDLCENLGVNTMSQKNGGKIKIIIIEILATPAIALAFQSLYR